MSRIEIDAYLEWVEKFAERCQVTLIAIREGKDPTDEGWDVLEELHKMWWNGRLTFYKTILDEPQTNAVEQRLF